MDWNFRRIKNALYLLKVFHDFQTFEAHSSDDLFWYDPWLLE